MFAKHGYEGTSVEEIAKRAKVSKPIVYEHFGGKEGLYAVIVDCGDGFSGQSLHWQMNQLGQRVQGEISTVVLDATVSRALIEQAATLSADCVAVGRHGQGVLAERLLGSTALDLIHHASSDVLVVP